MDKVIKYPIHEYFHTFQGEGVHMGKEAFFIRTYGCPVHCPWCDSAGTWHKDWTPDHILKRTGEEIAAQVPHDCDTVVITGGEPMILNLDQLIDELHNQGKAVHIETSGAFPYKGERRVDWMTLSPKKWKPPHPDTAKLANEFKIIVESPEDIHFYEDMIEEKCGAALHEMDKPVWLHPEWSKRQNAPVLSAISNAVKTSNYECRAGYQLHKLYMVDALDNRTQSLVPLGGDPARGM